MSSLNVESYIFINVFYLVLFCIHVCVDINSGVGVNKNYIFHKFKFHVCLQSSGE